MPENGTEGRPPLRFATAEDIVKRLQDSEYPLVALEALGWGMGPAQYGIRPAVAEAERLGQVITEKLRGETMVRLHPSLIKPQTFTVTYTSYRGLVTRRIHRSNMWDLKRGIARNAESAEPWSCIRVTDPEGNDVTAEYTGG